MKKKSIFILLLIIIGIISSFAFFQKKMDNNLKIGNNTSSQEIIDYILNISSYEAKIKVEVNSNKNRNLYILKQQFKKSGIMIQEVLEPSNIAGVRIVKNGNQLTIENTNLGLNTIFENYEYMSDNILDLSCFIESYKLDAQASWKEENNQIMMFTKKDEQEKTLWVDRITGNPIKLEVKWTNKNTSVYILYNEVDLNSLK